MASADRSFTDVLQDIVRDVQGIVRSEVRLAKTELAETLNRLKAAAPLLIFGAVTSLLAALFLIWAAVFALELVIPNWGAALVVMGALAILGAATLGAATRKLRRVPPKPIRTIASVKENAQWAKQQVK